jgi:hypothetical protein
VLLAGFCRKIGSPFGKEKNTSHKFRGENAKILLPDNEK